jgi:hypothetical protein
VTLEAVLSPTITAMLGRVTVTAAVLVAEPEVAVIVAVPSPTEVTEPDEETVATDAADDAHDTLAPPIVTLLWSLTVADNCCVSPKEVKLKLVAERVIDVATGVGVGVDAVGLLSPPQLCDRINKLKRTKGVSSRNIDYPSPVILYDTSGINFVRMSV